MADKVDQLFRDYFSGRLQNAIAFRKHELGHTDKPTDENVGGGKLENVNGHQEKVEGVIIKEDLDEELSFLVRQYDAMREFVSVIDMELYNTLDYYYNDQKHFVWEKVARLIHKSKEQCMEDRNKAKYRFLYNFSTIINKK